MSTGAQIVRCQMLELADEVPQSCGCPLLTYVASSTLTLEKLCFNRRGADASPPAVDCLSLRDREPLGGHLSIRVCMSLEVPLSIEPMEALSVEEIPTGDEWQYEPKWDGFRCLVFRDGNEVALQSKAGQPLARYF